MFSVQKKQNVLIIKANVKSLDYSHSVIFENIIKNEALQCSNVVLKLNKVITISNCFVKKLLNLKKRFGNAIDFVLCEISPELMSFFYIIKLEKYFEFYMDEVDAMLSKNMYVKRNFKVV